MPTPTRREVLSLAAGALMASAAPATSPALAQALAAANPIGGTLRGPTFFVFGTYLAPPFEMAKWKERNVNTIIGVGQGINGDEHHAMAEQLGLAQIRSPRGGKLDEDLRATRVIAFETTDEPTNIVNGAVRDTPDDVSAEQKPWRDRAAALGIVKPVFTNHIGNHIWYELSRIGLNLAEYHKRSNWYGSDTYQIADGRGNLLTQSGSTSTYQGHVLRLQREMAPGAPLLAFVQTVAFNTGIAVPTPGQLKTQIWSAVVNGASMIAAFPVRLTPSFAWDATPPDLADVMTKEFRAIRKIEPVLINDRRGGTRNATLHPGATPTTDPVGAGLPYPFEGRTVRTPEGKYTIVINLSDSAQRLDKPGWTIHRRHFAPNEVWHGPYPG